MRPRPIVRAAAAFRKETSEEKKQRKARLLQAQEQFRKFGVPALVGAALVVVALVIYATR
jgi:hypothetical protein